MTSPAFICPPDRPERTSRPKLHVHQLGPRIIGRHPLRHLRQDQEFKTLATEKLGYVFAACADGHVAVVIDETTKNLHPDVIVWAL